MRYDDYDDWLEAKRKKMEQDRKEFWFFDLCMILMIGAAFYFLLTT